jgi:hypothetical protein
MPGFLLEKPGVGGSSPPQATKTPLQNADLLIGIFVSDARIRVG